MAEVLKPRGATTKPAVVEPVTQEDDPTVGRPVVSPEDQGKEWNGEGNRVLAVRHGDASYEHVVNGLAQVPLTQADYDSFADGDDTYTGKYIAVARIDGPTGLLLPGTTVDFDEDLLKPLISSGAVRRERKDESE